VDVQATDVPTTGVHLQAAEEVLMPDETLRRMLAMEFDLEHDTPTQEQQDLIWRVMQNPRNRHMVMISTPMQNGRNWLRDRMLNRSREEMDREYNGRWTPDEAAD
jgi:hypothetical protein